MRVFTVGSGWFALGAIAIVVGCSNADSTTDPLAPIGLELALAPSMDTLFITDTLTGAETVQLVVTASAQNGGVPVPAGRVFESQNPTIATVDSNGLVHARTVGTADIVVRVNGVRAHSTIVVLHPTSRVVVTPITSDILEDNAFTTGDTTRVRAQAYGADGAPLRGVRYTFTSSDPSVATVDGEGKVTALKIGLTTIAATADGLTGTATVHVTRATRSLSLPAAAESIFVDNPIGPRDTAVIQPIAKDSLGAVRAGVVYTFSSSNPAVAVVSTSGVVTAKGLGTATISAVGADLVASTTLSVLSLAKSVTLAATAQTWLVGDTIQLHASAMGWHGAALVGRTYTYAEQGAGATVDSGGRAVFTAPVSASFTAATAFTTSSALVLKAFPREFVGGAAGSISSGGDATCGLLPLNRVYCFGSAPLIGIARDTSCFGDASDALPSPSPCTLVPLRVAGNLQLASVTVGDSVACALDLQSHAFCWGDEVYGEVGNGISRQGTATSPALVQGPMTGTAAFVQISAGQAHACGIDPSGTAYCWGKDSTFQLGGADGRHPVNSSTPAPVFPGTGLHFAAISAGGGHTCALTTNGVAYCWGLDVDGQLGRGTVGDSSDVPTPVSISGVSFVAISSGARHTCALTSSQQVYCWGANDFGQIAQSAGSRISTPTLVSGAFSSVSAGGSHTCALQSGVAYCWGRNDYGQLGRGAGTSGSPAFSSIPTAVQQAGLSFSVISAGLRTTCAVAADGAYCWGSSVRGALGSQVQAVGVPFPSKTAIPQ